MAVLPYAATTASLLRFRGRGTTKIRARVSGQDFMAGQLPELVEVREDG